MEAIARTRYLKGSPRKARLVIDMIRGQKVSRALAILSFTNKRAAEPIAKTLRSAIANATYKAELQNIAIDPEDLYVKACYVDMGPTKHRYRLRPAPQGRAYRERRHYCHITIEVSTEKPEEKSDKKKLVETEKVEKADLKKEKKAKAKETKETKRAQAAEETQVQAESTVEKSATSESAEKTTKRRQKSEQAKTEATEAKASEGASETGSATETEVAESKTSSESSQTSTEEKE